MWRAWQKLNKETAITLDLLVLSADDHLQTVWTQVRADKMSDLIWTQTVWHFEGIPKIIFWKKKKLLGKSIDDKNMLIFQGIPLVMYEQKSHLYFLVCAFAFRKYAGQILPK